MNQLIKLFCDYADQSSLSEAVDEWKTFTLPKIDLSTLSVGDVVQYFATKSVNVDEALLKVDGDVYRFASVHFLGGGEGEGERVERVVAVIKCTSGSEGILMGYVKVTGYYESYNGIEWDSSDEWQVVTPKPYIAYDWVAA